MTNMTIQLDPVALREATAQAIMGTLTPEVRATILEKAVSALLSPSTDSWNRGKSPLQQAFDAAVVAIAHEEARKYVAESPELRDRLAALLRETADRVLSADRDKLVERMSDAFVNSLRRD